MIIGGNETVLVQGITGKQGTFWSERMREYGTKVIGGVNPRRAGERHLDLPVWASAQDAAKEQKIDAAVMFVPPFGVKDAALDIIAAGVRKIVCLTEHVPVQDTMYFLAAARERGAHVIGPNTAGLVTTGVNFVGFMPAFNPRVFQKGDIGVISRSGSLGTLLCLNLVQAGLGISSFVGIGGDPIIGTTTREAVELLMNDPETDGIIMIGEIGGNMEAEAAQWLKDNMRKPVVGFIAGQTAPAGRRMGHAGAIVGGADDTAAAKMKIMRSCGIHVVDSPADIGKTMAEVIEKKMATA